MERRRPPETAAGYYVLHDFRRIDWAAWHDLTAPEREQRVAETVEFLEDEHAVDDGDLGVYSVHGHKADLLILVLRPTLRELDTFERQFAQLEFASLTERATSALGVTEASGYTEAAADFFDPEAEAEPGIERYMNARLYPNLPDADFLSFYFMNKRRDPDANWYDLPYEERAEHVSRHGEIGKEFAGSVTQMITGTMGFDDWEWGVTLFSEDMVRVKELLTAMRFDPSTSLFAEFGRFYVADRFPVQELPAYLDGETLTVDASETGRESISDQLTALADPPSFPAETVAVLVSADAEIETIEDEIDGMRGSFDHYDSHVETIVTEHDGHPVVVSGWETERAAETAAGFLTEIPGATDVKIGPVVGSGEPASVSTDDDAAASVRATLEDADVYAGQPHGEDIHALVLFSTASREEMMEEVERLAPGFDRYDTHRGTDVYDTRGTERTGVVSLWETAEAAETAGGYLADLPGIEDDSEPNGFATMGLFYRVKPEHRADFVDTFETVGEVLGEMDGHRETELLVNIEDDNDMFIASRWDDKEAAMEFFQSDAFRDTVQWGRDILADRPRHVFLV